MQRQSERPSLSRTEAAAWTRGQLSTKTACDIVLASGDVSWTFLATGVYKQRKGLEGVRQPGMFLLNRSCPYYTNALQCTEVRPEFVVAELDAKPGSTHLWHDSPDAMVAAVKAFLDA